MKTAVSHWRYERNLRSLRKLWKGRLITWQEYLKRKREYQSSYYPKRGKE